ncbi:MAG TPA: hypothetical protein PKJ15_04860 [Methanomassiliicoccales archaeon]|nr:hypothetical protein [Methanomassiliicoccales archaeon]
MGLFDRFRGRDDTRPEEELRRLVLQVLEVLRETEEIMDDLPPELRQGARRSFDESVGEPIGDCRKRLEKMDRKLLTMGLEDIPRPELTGLRERMTRLDDHLIRSYLGALKLTGDRRSRKAIRASAKRRADQVEELLKALERTAH